jgi:hypothetical protein
MQQETAYPARLSVDHPDRDLNRLTTFFRLVAAIPILVVLSSVSGGASHGGSSRLSASTAP